MSRVMHIKRKLAGGMFDSYLDKVLSVDPSSLIGCWLQNEGSGAVSFDSSGLGHNGAYTAVNLGQPGVPGMGMSSAGYDGLTSFNNIRSAGLANDNLLSNPGFETAGATWANWTDTVGDGAIANEVVIVHEGVDAAKLTSGATSNTKTAQAVVVIPGQRRRVRFWTQGDAVNAGRYGIYDVTNGADIIPIATTGVAAAAWGMVAVEYTVPAGCVSARTDLWCPPVNAGISYFDACEDRRMDGFQPDQGTVIVNAQVSGVGVWTDGTPRNLFYFGVAGAQNRIYIARTANNNQVAFSYEAGNIQESQATGGLANIDFASYGITWDISAGATGEVMYYIDGVATGATDVALGTWVGNLAAASAVIGALSTVPTQVWSGSIGPVALWNKALTPAQMAYLG